MSAPSTTTFYARENNARTTITNNPLAVGGTSITLATGTGALFPSSGTWLATLWDDTTYPDDPTSDPNMEVVLVTSRSSDTLTVTRAQSGTSDVQHASGSTIGLLVMDEALDQHETAINDLETVAYRTGWVAMGVTLTYSSVDDPTGVVTSSADISAILSVGMRIKFTNNAATVYGIVTAISGTTITFLHEIDPSDSLALNLMQNSAITAPFFSYNKAPYGFPLDPRKWTVEKLDTSNRSQATPTLNTWYNVGTTNSQLSVPIGCWIVQYKVRLYIDNAGGAGVAAYSFTTLSTANNSESDGEFTAGSYLAENDNLNEQMHTFFVEKRLTLASKTLYYLNAKTTWTTGTMGNLNFDATGGSSVVTKVIRAICAYL